MRYLILIHDLALIELQKAVDYYNNLVPLLGLKVLDEFNEAILFVEKRPMVFQRRFGQYRQIKLKKFPYYVVYRIEENVIAVYRLFHVKKKPIKKYKA